MLPIDGEYTTLYFHLCRMVSEVPRPSRFLSWGNMAVHITSIMGEHYVPG